MKRSESKPDFDFMVETVRGWICEEGEKNRQDFVSMKESELGALHHFLGRGIRNHFLLWQYSWTPEVKDGVDYSSNHPDAISMRVIKEAWRREKSDAGR